MLGFSRLLLNPSLGAQEKLCLEKAHQQGLYLLDTVSGWLETGRSQQSEEAQSR